MPTQSFGFTWGKASTMFHTKIKLMLAICGFSKRVARITSEKDMLSAMVIQNVYIYYDKDGNPTRCEEGDGCLDFDCPLNKTTWETYKTRVGVKGRKPPNFGERLDFNRGEDDGLQDLSHLVKDPHSGAIIVSDK